MIGIHPEGPPADIVFVKEQAVPEGKVQLELKQQYLIKIAHIMQTLYYFTSHSSQTKDRSFIFRFVGTIGSNLALVSHNKRHYSYLSQRPVLPQHLHVRMNRDGSIFYPVQGLRIMNESWFPHLNVNFQPTNHKNQYAEAIKGPFVCQ